MTEADDRKFRSMCPIKLKWYGRDVCEGGFQREV